MEKKKLAMPLVCHDHSRPVVDLFYNPVMPNGYFLINASKGKRSFPPNSVSELLGADWVPLNVTWWMVVSSVVLARVVNCVALYASLTNPLELGFEVGEVLTLGDAEIVVV
jgi:hypothetical protein